MADEKLSNICSYLIRLPKTTALSVVSLNWSLYFIYFKPKLNDWNVYYNLEKKLLFLTENNDMSPHYILSGRIINCLPLAEPRGYI